MKRHAQMRGNVPDLSRAWRSRRAPNAGTRFPYENGPVARVALAPASSSSAAPVRPEPEEPMLQIFDTVRASGARWALELVALLLILATGGAFVAIASAL